MAGEILTADDCRRPSPMELLHTARVDWLPTGALVYSNVN
jgi:hypothetical protein